MTTPDDGKAFLQMCLAKRLIDKDQVREVWQLARQAGVPPQQILIQRGLMAAPTIEALEKEVRRTQEPRIIGGFRLVKPLGQGGMARVFLAEQVSLGREVALKLMSSHIANDTESAERFLREARTAATVNHPNVVSIIDVGRADGQLYMALELVTGGDAAQLAEKAGGALTEGRALALLIDCANGLHALHEKRLVHRDLKPSNIFITGDGHAKLGDLGLARSSDDADRMTMTGHLVGTPAFMSPEQANASKDVDIRSDIYALGATLFALVTGRQPFEGSGPIAVAAKVLTTPLPDPRSLAPHLTELTSALIQRAMAKEIGNRFQTPAELRDALEAALAQVPSMSPTTQYRNRSRAATAVFGPLVDSFSNDTASTISIPGRRVNTRTVRRKTQRSRLPVIIACLVVLIVVGVTLVALMSAPRSATNASPAIVAGTTTPNANTPAINPTAVPPVTATKVTAPTTNDVLATPPIGNAPTRPSWAQGHGQDPFGHWATMKVGTVEQRLRWIPAGKSHVGVPKGLPGRLEMEDEAEIVFTFGVWLADTECTQALYYAVIGTNPSAQVGDDLPVTHVTISEAVAFTRELSKLLPGAKVRMPSRAEWERGCRAGTRTLFATGDDPESLAGFANMFDRDRAKATNSKAKFHFSDGHVELAPVASFKPNQWGIYDMHGNVCEYCLGAFGALPNHQRDPMISENATQNGFIKGGSYISEDHIKARAGALPYIGTNSRNPDIGLRFLIESR